MAESDVERRFLNIKTKTDRRSKEPKHTTILEWLEPSKGDGWAKHSLEETEPPVESFFESLSAFAPQVKAWLASALNVDPENTSADLKILGAAYSYKDDGSYTIVLSATMAVPGLSAPLVLNFSQIVPEKTLRLLLVELADQSAQYVEGVRGQLALPLPDEGADVDDGGQGEMDV